MTHPNLIVDFPTTIVTYLLGEYPVTGVAEAKDETLISLSLDRLTGVHPAVIEAIYDEANISRFVCEAVEAIAAKLGLGIAENVEVSLN